MKLLNKSLIYISVSLLFIVSIWAVVFYFKMLNEIKDSVDDGLEDYKRQIVYRAKSDTTILNRTSFEEGFFAIREISRSRAISARDRYLDSEISVQDANDGPETRPVRMLTTAFENDGHYYELRIINSMVKEDDLIEELFRGVVLLYLALILSAIIVNKVVLQRLWRPFYLFLSQLRDYRIGSSKKLPGTRTTTKEFNDLQNAVDILLKYNIETYERQKEFIGNAAHELQTPLAIATHKLELLIEKGNLQTEQAQGIAEIMNIVERLVRLNKSLLLLGKIENGQFPENQNIDLIGAVLQNVDDLVEIAEFKKVTISVDKMSAPIVLMDISLANIIISNLLRNAVFHNIPNGTVTIDILEKSIRVSNTGKNERLDRDRLFSRFYKSETSQNSIGLGLAIVKAVCVEYGFSISYSFENDLHIFEWHFEVV